MSQEPQHIEDRGFSPWITQQKGGRQFERHSYHREKHQFLANIHLSPKISKRVEGNNKESQ